MVVAMEKEVKPFLKSLARGLKKLALVDIPFLNVELTAKKSTL